MNVIQPNLILKVAHNPLDILRIYLCYFSHLQYQNKLEAKSNTTQGNGAEFCRR